MIKLPMLGTSEKTELSRYQVTLVDKTDKSLHPMEYPRINRFFDSKDNRNTFLQLFENSIRQSGGRLVHNKVLSHPSFQSFEIYDKQGVMNFEITVYS